MISKRNLIFSSSLGKYHLFLVITISLIMSTAQIHAQEPPVLLRHQPSQLLNHPTLPLQLSITTSGGVSLGAYQAGYLYYLIETIKLNPHLFDLRIVTGSSAGSINSILAAMELGKNIQPKPSNSLFFKVWTNLNIDELLDVSNAPPLALSSRKVFDSLVGFMEEEWNKGFSKDHDIAIGITATRVVSRQIDVTGMFSVPRQEEKFVFRLLGQGENKEPLVFNYVDISHGIAQPLLPFVKPNLKKNSGKNFDTIKNLMFASSAFPLAFPAQELEFCMTYPELQTSFGQNPFNSCPKPEFKELFIDGSMFDRNPLGLAYRISDSGLKIVDNKIVWRQIPDSREGKIPDSLFMIYLNAMNESYPSYKPEETYKQIESLFPSFGSYSQQFIRSAQAKEISNLIDHHPHIKNQIDLTYRNFPTASGFLANFFGFFDEKLRIFDYYLGMYDAHQYLNRNLKTEIRRAAGIVPTINYPETNNNAGINSDWDPYFCMLSFFDHNSKYQDRCNQKALQDLKILMQISMNSLYSQCSNLPYDETIIHTHCIQAMNGNLPPVLQPIKTGNFETDWKKKEHETKFQYTMRQLEQYQFWFSDLKLKREDAWLAMSRIREILAGALDDYAQKLPRAESILLRVLGKPALNFFKYQPPQLILYLAGGKGAEAGLSAAGRYTPSRWIRFNFALQIKGLAELISPRKNMLALTPLLGLEFEHLGLSSPALQPRLGIRAGYQFSTGDSFLKERCNNQLISSNSGACSAPVIQTFLVFTLFERIRLQGGIEWFPYFLPPMNKNRKNVWNGFIELGWQWISPFSGL